MGTGRAQVEGRGEGRGFESQGCFSSRRKERDKTAALEVRMRFFFCANLQHVESRL